MLAHRLRRWPNIVPTLAERLVFAGRGCVWDAVYIIAQQTKIICMTSVQRRPNGFDVGQTLYKWYTNVLCLPEGCPHSGWFIIIRGGPQRFYSFFIQFDPLAFWCVLIPSAYENLGDGGLILRPPFIIHNTRYSLCYQMDRRPRRATHVTESPWRPQIIKPVARNVPVNSPFVPLLSVMGFWMDTCLGHCSAFYQLFSLTAKLFNLNFYPLEVVSRWRDLQLQVSTNSLYLTK